jgi:hypothetical protein
MVFLDDLPTRFLLMLNQDNTTPTFPESFLTARTKKRNGNTRAKPQHDLLVMPARKRGDNPPPVGVYIPF